jgi:hypothetical protein
MDLFLPQPSEKKTKKRTQKNDLCVELLMFIDLVFVHCHICIGLYVYILIRLLKSPFDHS